tara:strand:- start:451 stop:819 length:369 start_codon:yes stop_codon:yes gene_type:complete
VQQKKENKLRQAIKVATLPKHATTSQARKMLEKKIRDRAIAEHLETRKAVNKLLSKNRRNVKTVDGYREKAMVSSGTGARISMSQSDIVKGVETNIFSQADALKLAKYLHNHYSYTRVKANA